MKSRHGNRLSIALVGALVFTTACDGWPDFSGRKSSKRSRDESSEEDDPPKRKRASADASGTSSAPLAPISPSASAAAIPSGDATTDKGPMVLVPEGRTSLGYDVCAVPRVTDEELRAVSVNLQSFYIDLYPFPNDPTASAKTGVSRAEAETLCAQEGKRLCSEIEWERACKGLSGQAFAYGKTYDKSACALEASGKIGARSRCESGFGMRDPHGLVFEWTASPWGRGTTGLATVRGYRGGPNVVRERCASGQGREPMRGFEDVGFRCCKGDPNPATVDLPMSRQPVLTADATVAPELAKGLLGAMPADHQRQDHATVSIDRVWRWHPRDNEELLLARWKGDPKDKRSTYYELAIFQMCGGAPTRVARLRGPVESLGVISEGGAKERLTMEVTTGKERGTVQLSYWFGTVDLKQPDFIKAGYELAAKPEKERTPRIPGGLRPRLPKPRK